MSKQTAIDWLIQALESDIEIDESNMVTIKMHEHDYITSKIQAKAMEKEQIIKANEDASTNELGEFLNGKQYYNETYERKVSDDHLPDVNEMVASVQKLIDKDIFNQAILAMEEMYGSGCDAEIDAYFRGAKWMKEELNKQV